MIQTVAKSIRVVNGEPMRVQRVDVVSRLAYPVALVIVLIVSFAL